MLQTKCAPLDEMRGWGRLDITGLVFSYAEAPTVAKRVEQASDDQLRLRSMTCLEAVLCIAMTMVTEAVDASQLQW